VRGQPVADQWCHGHRLCYTHRRFANPKEHDEHVWWRSNCGYEVTSNGHCGHWEASHSGTFGKDPPSPLVICEPLGEQ
jgi:hypothetical protein